MLDEYTHSERIAICMDSGMDYTQAKKIADSEQPKEEPEAVRRAKALRAKIAADKLAKSNYKERY